MIGLSNAFYPFIGQPGLVLSVDSGDVLSAGVVQRVAAVQISLSPSVTTYVFLTVSTFTISSNTTGFAASGVFPIAIAVTNAKGIISLTDMRADIQSVGGSGNATAIQGTAVSATVPTNGQVLTYVSLNTDAEWKTPVVTPFRTAKVTMHDTDILQLSSTPFVVVPAVSGSVIVPVQAMARFLYGGVAVFTGTQLDDLTISNDGGTGFPLSMFTGSSANFMDNGVGQNSFAQCFLPNSPTGTVSFSPTGSGNLVLTNGVIDVTGGDPGGNTNSLIISVQYSLYDIATETFS